jgi:hypothetical protein
MALRLKGDTPKTIREQFIEKVIEQDPSTRGDKTAIGNLFDYLMHDEDHQTMFYYRLDDYHIILDATARIIKAAGEVLARDFEVVEAS